MSEPARAHGPRSSSRDLEVVYRVRGRDREVVRGVSFAIEQRQSYGLVGESGCGKSTVALSDRPLPPAQRPCHARARSRSPAAMCSRCGGALRQLPPRRRLDGLPEPRQRPEPDDPVGEQVAEVFELARRRPAGGPRARARRAAGGAHRRPRLGAAPLPASALGRHAAARRDRDGARDRSRLLILDEPTTGLDATVEAEVLDLIAELQERLPPPCSSSATTSA